MPRKAPWLLGDALGGNGAGKPSAAAFGAFERPMAPVTRVPAPDDVGDARDGDASVVAGVGAARGTAGRGIGRVVGAVDVAIEEGGGSGAGGGACARTMRPS